MKKSVKSASRVTPLIKLSGVSKAYKVGKQEVPALNDLALSIKSGEVVAIMGPSGSGKSTLMHLIAGLDSPTSGEVVVNGHSLKSLNDRQLSEYRNQTIGFVFQFFYLQPYLNVLQNTEVPLFFGKAAATQREQKAREVLEAVGLSDRLKHRPSQLSGGQMQRVAIARALVTNPKLILADEPTGNLDRQTGREVIKLLLKVRELFGTTVVIVTHDSAIARLADRVIKIDDGKIK